MILNGPSERRRQRPWTDAEKREIMAETEVPGASVSLMARRHDFNANFLFMWKWQFEQDDT
ncbi:MAG: transposase [Geminicoccaceae bacterium]